VNASQYTGGLRHQRGFIFGWLLVAPVLVAVGVVVLVGDEPLSSEAQAWDAWLETRPQTSQAYDYLMGLDVLPPDDPALAGSRLLAAYEEAVAEAEDLYGAVEHPEWTVHERLPLPDTDQELFCSLLEPECQARLEASGARINAALETNRVLLERLDTFLVMDDYVSLASPTVYEPYPPIYYLLNAHGLGLLEIYQEARRGNPGAALERLMRRITRVRAHLATADHLVVKMALERMLHESLDHVVYLSGRHGLAVTPIAPLSTQERSLELSLLREYAGMALMYRDLDGNPALFGPYESVPQWWVRALYKPHMTINMAHEGFDYWYQRSLLPAVEFVATRDHERPEPKVRLWTKLTNYVGTVLVAIAGPSYEDYIARLHDLDTKIQLTNAVVGLHGEAAIASAAAVQSPYDGTSARYVVEVSALCLHGAASREPGGVCVPHVQAQLGIGS